jgi:phosphatidate cytidylyltransferase
LTVSTHHQRETHFTCSQGNLSLKEPAIPALKFLALNNFGLKLMRRGDCQQTLGPGGKWADLGARVFSALVIAGIGLFDIIVGGWVLQVTAGALAAIMLWELTRMLVPQSRKIPLTASVLSGAVLALAPIQEPYTIYVLLALCSTGIALTSFPHLKTGGFYAACILFGCLSLVVTREYFGFGWVLWLILIVIATDVAGYFVGKTLGGAKFWPSLSPKKTWSGIAGGWVAAACVGAGLSLGSGATLWVVTLSVFLSFASQLGDIMESAIKRRSGVKDSSNLIPGHGGFLDRFDGLIAAALVFWVIAQITGFPKGGMF